MRALSTPPFGNYRVWWSLAESKYAGTALLVKKCFKPHKVYFNLDKLGTFFFWNFVCFLSYHHINLLHVVSCLSVSAIFQSILFNIAISDCLYTCFDHAASKHEPDGRVILAEFETFRLLNTYSPNNGWKEEENAFQRRRKWDKRIVEFLSQTSDKPLIWCGDLNVRYWGSFSASSFATLFSSKPFQCSFRDSTYVVIYSHEEIDVSHPDFFATAKLNGYVPPNNEVINTEKQRLSFLWFLLFSCLSILTVTSYSRWLY